MENNTNYKGTIEELNSILFKQMEKLEDPKNDLEKEVRRSQAMVGLGTTIVNGMKAGVEYLKVQQQKGKLNGKGSKKEIGNV